MPDTFASPLDLELAFYEAFERRDLRAMIALWAEDERAFCVHPAGHRMLGLPAIQAGWEALFEHMPDLHIHVQDRRVIQGQGVTIHHVTEMVHVIGDTAQQHWVNATNIYVLTEHGWRILAHHASPLLADDDLAPVLH
ncbi:YybH family protein [Leeia oryzae]|uniref:YybH family protein n=1 Tax=Leeia oryzae TaxID=356662 RepID=UPI000369F32E|nr:nuclear transport factor 2 family protein [Leeia oryzae]